MDDLYLDGRYLPLGEGRVSVEDRGFQFGDGVYEVIRSYHGRPFRLSRHLARLEQSLKGVEIPLPEPLPKIEEVCRRLLEGRGDAMIYIQVTRGAAPRVHAFPKNARPTFVAYVREVKRHPDGKTYTLRSVPDERWGRCNLKVVALLPNVLAREKAVRSGCDEGLFVREDGTVTEGTSSNAFMARGGAVRTHPADSRILDGVTREAVIERARSLGIRVEERPFTLADAQAADEMFMTGTLTEIMPAVALDGKAVGSGAAGSLTLRIRAAFRELAEKETSA